MKLKDVLDKSIQFFKDKKFDSPRLDAELLISSALKMERMQLYLKYESPLSEKEVSDCRDVIRRRTLGEPVAYITEEKGFYGHIFRVGPGVLIPRPETEDIVEACIEFIKARKISAPRILDLGAGTGCIGFSILKNNPDATLISVEKSPQAFKYLEVNRENLKLSDRAEIIMKDVNDISANELDMFDIIVANPPYIAMNDPEIEAGVKKFEPAEALFAENNGLELLKSWSTRFAKNLKSPGLMQFEMGYLQGSAMQIHFESLQVFSKVSVVKDLSGLDRIIKGVR